MYTLEQRIKAVMLYDGYIANPHPSTIGYICWNHPTHREFVQTETNPTEHVAGYTNYQTSWDWLMPVAIKIGQNKGVVDIIFSHFINCRITDFNSNGQQFASDRSTDIECVFNTISSYCIDWCKSQNIEL